MNKSKPIPKPRSTIIKVEGANYKKHPIYDSFAAAANGQIINLVKKIDQYSYHQRWICCL